MEKYTVSPLYGQIALIDSGTVDLPDWETGAEAAVASEHAVLIATRPDTDGDVEIEVYTAGESVDGESVFDGELAVASGTLEVGSIVGSDTHAIASRVGFVSIRILVEPAEMPNLVRVVVGSSRS